jgi:hypothetical protein
MKSPLPVSSFLSLAYKWMKKMALKSHTGSFHIFKTCIIPLHFVSFI